MAAPEPVQLPTLPAALAQRARTTPHEPWLFYQSGWDWTWRSWGQVADNVARGARQLGARRGERLGCPPLTTPDAVTAALAIQAAGAAAAPGTGTIPLPACRSRIDRATLEVPEVAASSDTVSPEDEAFPGVRHADAAQRAARLAEALAPALADAGERPIVAVSPRLAAARHEDVLAWSLASGAAWALEDQPGNFVSAVLWCRPSVVLATAEELAELARKLLGQRSRRWIRLRAVVFEDGSDVDTASWDELGIAAVRLKR